MIIREQWKYKIVLNNFEKPVKLSRQSFPNYCEIVKSFDKERFYKLNGRSNKTKKKKKVFKLSVKKLQY